MFFKKEVYKQSISTSESVSTESSPESNSFIEQALTNPIKEEPVASKEKSADQLRNLVIGAGVHLQGSFNVPSKTSVSGLIAGKLITKDLIVEESGKVQGEVDCQIADIAGYVENCIQVHEFLTLRASAIIAGDIFYHEIAIERGAKITGKLARL